MKNDLIGTDFFDFKTLNKSNQSIAEKYSRSTMGKM